MKTVVWEIVGLQKKESLSSVPVGSRKARPWGEEMAPTPQKKAGKAFQVKGPCIGIDFGTHSARVAVIRGDAPVVVANAQGNHNTPSVVGFQDAERLVGDVAHQQAAKNQTNTVSEAKRLLGKKHDDPSVAKDAKRWRFAVANKEGRAGVSVDFKGAKTVFGAEQICGAVMENIKATAEAFVHSPVKNCVLTAPIHFNDEQRQALVDAAAVSGLTCLRVISEPVAAAMSYDFDKTSAESHCVAVFNMGSMSSDVTILGIQSGLMTLQGFAVDHEIGGTEIDDNLVAFCCKEFTRKNKVDPTESARSIAKIKAACEVAKIQLSQSTNTKVFVESAHEGFDMNVAVSKARFESMNDALIGRIPELVRKALEGSGCSMDDIDRVILVGGPTRIPKVQAAVQGAFSGKEVLSTVPSEEAVALGAAIQAERLVGIEMSTDEALNTTCEVSATPMGIYIGVEGGSKALMIAKGTPLPCEKVVKFEVAGGGPSVLVEVYEGNDEKTTSKVATLVLEEIQASPVTVTLHVDSGGELDLHAKDASGTARHNISIGAKEE